MFMVIREESCELRRSGIKVTKSDAAPPELITFSIRYYKHWAPPEPKKWPNSSRHAPKAPWVRSDWNAQSICDAASSWK
jgi:hypothetical protein